MAVLFANSGDPDQMSHSAASDLGLHCLSVAPLRVSRLQWIKESFEDAECIGKHPAETVLFVNQIVQIVFLISP